MAFKLSQFKGNYINKKILNKGFIYVNRQSSKIKNNYSLFNGNNSINMI